MKIKMNKQQVFILIKGLMLDAAISILFYNSLIAFILLIPLVALFYKYKQKDLELKQRLDQEKEFRQMILSVSANVSAGYSVENAFRESYKDIVMMYGRESVMAREIYLLIQKLNNNEQLENILLDMGYRSGSEDIQEFANVFQISKRRGGDIRAAISNTATVLSDKIDVRRQIHTIMSQKQMEQNIMKIMPFAIMTYVSFTNRGFFNPLYHNVMGILIMTGALGIYIAAWLLSDKILRIEI